MRSGHPVNALAASLYHACFVQLLPHQYPEIKWLEKPDPATGSRQHQTGKITESRPRPDQCEVTLFQQTWGSTALGFGGIGGQAITSADTVVVEGPQGDACVYFGGQFAYHVKRPNERFRGDMAVHRMAEVRGATARYELPAKPGGV
jgi:hypothetical protein